MKLSNRFNTHLWLPFTTCTNPIIHFFYPPNFLKIIVCNFSWDIICPKRRSKTFFEVKEVYYGICASRELRSLGRQAEVSCFPFLTCLHTITFVLLSIVSRLETISFKICGICEKPHVASLT